MKAFGLFLGVLPGVFVGFAAAPVKAAQAASAADWRVGVELLTDFPLDVGAGAVVVGPHGLRGRTSVGWLPSAYLALANDVAVELSSSYPEPYSEADAALVESALKDSLVWRIGAGWQPSAEHGFSIDVHYGLVTLGGGATTAEVVESTTGRDLSDRAAAVGTVEIDSTLHQLGFEASWTFGLEALVERSYLRLGLGAAFTVASSSAVRYAGRVRAASAVAAFEDYTEAYLDDVYTQYVHAPTLSVAVGWRPW